VGGGAGFGGYGSLLSSIPPRLMTSFPKNTHQQHHFYNKNLQPSSNLSLAPVSSAISISPFPPLRS
jgi:hypothetical protein